MKRRRHGAPILEQNVSECSPSAPVGEIDNPLAGTRPLFEERAKIVTARSISSASRTSIGLTSTPNADGFIFFAMASLGAKIAVQSNHTHHVEAGIGEDDVGRERDQFRRVFAGSVDTACGPADVEARIVAVGPAQFRQPLHEGGELSPPCRVALVRTQKDADAPHPLALLRPCSERPSRCAAQQRDELAASQLIEEHSVPY